MNFARKLAYSLGSFATALAYQSFAIYLIFFYVDVMKLSPYLAAIGMIIFGIWNAINDPILGYLSDRTRTRWGRRIPYLAFGILPLGLFYYLLWVPGFSELNQVFQLFIYFVLAICLFDTFYSLIAINLVALYPEMFRDLTERTQVNSLRQSFWMLGLGAGMILPPLIYANLGWGWFGLIFAVTITLCFLLALWGCRENLVYSQEPQPGFMDSIRATFKNRPFWLFTTANMLTQYSLIMALASSPFYSKYILHLRNEETVSFMVLAFSVAIFSLYIWRKLLLRFEKKHCWQGALLLLMLALLPCLFVQQDHTPLLISVFLLGFGLGGILLLEDILLSEIIDSDEITTGKRREGTYFGINNFVNRLAILLEAISFGGVFIVTGYNRFIFSQPREFIYGLRLLIAGFPIVALILAFVIVSFYPLYGRKLDEMKSKLSEIHQKKGVS